MDRVVQEDLAQIARDFRSDAVALAAMRDTDVQGLTGFVRGTTATTKEMGTDLESMRDRLRMGRLRSVIAAELREELEDPRRGRQAQAGRYDRRPSRRSRRRHSKRAALLEESGATFAIVPYGTREQGRDSEDNLRGVFDIQSGRHRHFLGTDSVGRDVLSRLLYGTRISLTVGLIAVAIYVLIGIILGALAGYFGGKTDLLIMRAVEIIICVPGLFLILTIIALFRTRSIFMIMFAIGLVGWTGIARLIRGEFIRERGREYVHAARSLGLSAPRIIFRHVLPNAVAPVIVSATFGVAGAIVTESTLSFLGWAIRPFPRGGRSWTKGAPSRSGTSSPRPVSRSSSPSRC